MRTLFFTAVLSSVFLFGCSSKPVEPEPDDVTKRIEGVINETNGLLNQMVSLERSRMAGVPMKDPAAGLPAGHPLLRPVSLTWSGDLRVVSRRLADLAGLDLMITGKAPVPLVINVRAVEQPLVRVLEDVGIQAGNIADLSYDKTKNSLEVRYK